MRGNKASEGVGRFMLIFEGRLVQIKYIDHDYEQDRNPGYFLLATGPEDRTIWLGHLLHSFVELQMKKKKELRRVWKMEEVAIPSFPILVGNMFDHHAGVGLEREHVLRYQMLVIPEGRNLKGAVQFPYGCSLGDQEGLGSGATTRRTMRCTVK